MTIVDLLGLEYTNNSELLIEDTKDIEVIKVSLGLKRLGNQCVLEEGCPIQHEYQL